MKWDKFITKSLVPSEGEALTTQRTETIEGQVVVVNVYAAQPSKPAQQVKCKSGRKTRSSHDVKIPLTR